MRDNKPPSPSPARNGMRHALVGMSLLILLPTISGCERGFRAGAEPEPVGGPPVMRRLTESQYRATVADIFGPDIPVTARFERGLRMEGLLAVGAGEAGLSPFSIEQYHNAALGVAAAVTGEAHRERLVPCTPASEASFDASCATRFVQHYGLRLFRRPLQAEETTRFVEAARRAQERLGNFYSGLEFALAGMMVSPEFLLRIERPEPGAQGSERLQLDAYSKATRLAYFLTNSTPDEELLRAAGAGELDRPAGLRKQVDRLIESPRFEQAVRAFFSDMMHFDTFDELAKDPLIYPAYNSEVALDAQEQTLRTVIDHVIDQNGDYRDLFTTRKAFLTRALGVVYRLPVPTRNGWEVGEFPPETHRAGIQSHVAFLALHSHPGRSSPSLRGKAAREIFLCQEVPDPPAGVDFAVVQDGAAAMPTARDRLSAHSTEPSCVGCHKIMDPLGFTLENFDGLGIFRRSENGAVIDASGSLDGTAFDTPTGLAAALRNHPETPRCLVEKLYRFSVGRDTRMEERPYMDYLVASFKSDQYRVRDLMRRIALSKNFFAVSSPEDLEHEDLEWASQSVDGDLS